MSYTVTFIQYHTYNVEADNDYDAERERHMTGSKRICVLQ